MRARHIIWALLPGRGTEVAITAPTRNRMGGVSLHVGSNPTLSAKLTALTRTNKMLDHIGLDVSDIKKSKEFF